MKRIFALLLVLMMVMALNPVKAQNAGSLEIYITGLPESGLDWFRNEAFPAFAESYGADVNLEILTGGWGDFDATVAGWITTGSGPDIVYLGSEYAATYGSLLKDLSDYFDESDLSAFLPAAVETVSWDGMVRGLPLLMSPRPIFYRTDLMAEGSEIPTTFEEALAFVEANSIVEDNAMVQMGFMDIGSGLFDAQEFIGYIWSAGGELYYEDGTSAFDSDVVAEVLQYMYDRRRVMLPTEATAGLPPFEGYPITSDRVVSGIFPLWNMPPTSDEVWDDIVIAPYPAGTAGEPIVQVFIDWLSVPQYVPDEKLELVTDFLKFITSQENAIALSEVVGYTPVREDAWDAIRENPVWDTMLDLTVTYGRSFSDIRASAELRPLIVEQVMLFLSDQQSLEDTQMFLKEDYDGILADNGYLD
ncbi:MAG: extracellular solute-binding protein [Anaerolineaceae bacterium]|nr:MAG: extracellular solute-binding protein [Anaerolineaceae bacterium]